MYILWKVSSGWHENYINYSNTTKNNILFIDASALRRKPSSGLTSGAGRQYVKAPLVSIHVVGLPDPYCLPYESACFAWFSINHLCVRPVYHMILIANMICDCRFVADTGCPGLFCSSEHSCDTIHFFMMFFYSCSVTRKSQRWFIRYCVKTVNVFTLEKQEGHWEQE